MSARRRPNMRRLVATTVELIEAGELTVEVAAQKLFDSGVPVAVIGRVLGVGLKPALPSAVSAEANPIGGAEEPLAKPWAISRLQGRSSTPISGPDDVD